MSQREMGHYWFKFICKDDEEEDFWEIGFFTPAGADGHGKWQFIGDAESYVEYSFLHGFEVGEKIEEKIE